MTTIRLEPFAETHLEALAPVILDSETLRFTRIPDPPPDGFARAWLRRYQHGRVDGTCEGFAIVDDASGEFLGLALAPQIDGEARTAELGYVVAREARGRGVATEALRQLTEWAIGERGMLRVELQISVDNEGSKRVAERCGYLREGVLRSVHIKQGRREDTEVWSRLARDP